MSNQSNCEAKGVESHSCQSNFKQDKTQAVELIFSGQETQYQHLNIYFMKKLALSKKSQNKNQTAYTV